MYSFQVLYIFANLRKCYKITGEGQLSTLRMDLCDAILSKYVFIKDCGVQKFIGVMLKCSLERILSSPANNFPNYSTTICRELKNNLNFILLDKHDYEFNKNLFECIGY